MNSPITKHQRALTGIVVSTKMAKTIVVEVTRVKEHRLYHKQFTVTKRFKVHDEKNTAKVGDQVTFVECRPLSKDKRWRLVVSDKPSA